MISRTPDLIAMPHAEHELLSLAELRRGLDACGVDLSDSQLKRLRREGLLPIEGQRHPPGVRGSESLYPAWALGQLELVSRLEARERRFAQLRIVVRWHGGWVRPDKLRTSLIELLEPISVAARKLIEGVVDEGDRADRLAQELVRHPGRSGVSRLMYRRLRNAREDVERTMYALAALATGNPVEWQNHDPNDPTEPLLAVLERAWGIDRARHDDIAGHGPLLRDRESSEDMLGQLQQAGTFELLNAEAAFVGATDEEIERAFDDAIAFAEVAETFDAIQSFAGEDIGGLGSISEIGRAHEAIDKVMLVRGLLLMRPLSDECALDAVIDAARAAAPQLRVAQELSRSLPECASFLRLDGGERLATLPVEERERVTREARAYLEANPELGAIVERAERLSDEASAAERASSS
jgi:hypothetical protein